MKRNSVSFQLFFKFPFNSSKKCSQKVICDNLKNHIKSHAQPKSDTRVLPLEGHPKSCAQSMACFTPLTPELAFTLTATKAAINICRTHARILHATKRDGTPVCTADLLIQSRVQGLLAAHFPGDTLLAEEHLPAETLLALGEPAPPGGAPGRGGRQWVLDPIDGTAGYLRGESYATGLCLPARCAGVALPEEGVVLLGEPGALRRVRACGGVAPPPKGGWLLSGGELRVREWGRARRLCCGSLVKYAAVARGHAEVFVQVLKGGERVWDHAAGIFCVEAAGGRVSDEVGGWVGVADGELVSSGRVIVASGRGVEHEVACEIVARALGC